MEQPLYNEYAAQLAYTEDRQLTAQYETEAGPGGSSLLHNPLLAKKSSLQSPTLAESQGLPGAGHCFMIWRK